MSKPVSIYVLRDPITGRVRYVGQSVDVSARYQYHLADTSTSYKARWIQDLRNIDLVPILEVLEIVADGANERERWWIDEMKRKGEPLTNMFYAGPDRRRILDPEAEIRRIAKSRQAMSKTRNIV